jgi:hypothetical protein
MFFLPCKGGHFAQDGAYLSLIELLKVLTNPLEKALSEK